MKGSTAFLPIEIQLALRTVHESWRDPVELGLAAMHAADPTYFEQLCSNGFLPTDGRLFAAFELPIEDVRYVLIGEGPYPREDSATGVCFMDGAVKQIWSPDGAGLSKKVNRATSLRNFIKMLLVADGRLDESVTSGEIMRGIAQTALAPDSGFIQTLPELQQNLHKNGFLLLNASLVFRTSVAPARDGKSWQIFLQTIFAALHSHSVSFGKVPSLILWGKIAEQLQRIHETSLFPQIVAEHPYNLSFIKNRTMQNFFRPMQLLKSCSKEKFC
ncbi:uracil-DNA glycosylase [Undibacterium jejuense]|uniref:Uracil-DNA glycosylase n=1 Tax=Undibacterium jejuense TaxID=1344949 RepID=A0A923HL74_9BURK|nr:uracil-DNA glycosylase [Undibacterium jejuense]MBC3861696.1 uracil-DNA glycosylase [Undibacterium jejuense]